MVEGSEWCVSTVVMRTKSLISVMAASAELGKLGRAAPLVAGEGGMGDRCCGKSGD